MVPYPQYEQDNLFDEKNLRWKILWDYPFIIASNPSTKADIANLSVDLFSEIFIEIKYDKGSMYRHPYHRTYSYGTYSYGTYLHINMYGTYNDWSV